MYPASFPGLGRGLDFLLPSFLVSRQEKKIEAWWIRSSEYHFNDDECVKRDTFSGYNNRVIWKRITFLGHSFHRWNVCGAYAIRPYLVIRKRVDFSGYNIHVSLKRVTFSISIMYSANFPGLGRGLDFLLPSFLVSRQEKKVEARWIRPTEYHFNDDECRKRDTFLGYNDLIIWKRITFLGYSFHRWNVCGAYAIRPYRVTRKRIAFLRYNDQIILKRITFWIFIFDEWWKRGSFSGYIDLGIWKSGALPPCPYLLFFPWWKKRRQKKIKASAEAGEVDRVHDWSWKRITFSGYIDLGI